MLEHSLIFWTILTILVVLFADDIYKIIFSYMYLSMVVGYIRAGY